MTAAPIFRQLTLDPRNTPYQQLIRQLRDGELNLDAPYQRGHVWGAERQRNLIKSVSMGLPTGSVFVNERDVLEPYVVIDGKQRITAVMAFTDGKLSVPADWFPAERMLREGHGDTITFEDFTESGQRGWWNHAAITVYHSRFTGPDAEQRERELFALINYGGVPQGESDL